MEEERRAPRVRAASISGMSQLLLAGWAMLAESCPACGVPLMRSPDGAQLLCTNCGPSGPEAEALASHQQAAQQQGQPTANGHGPSYDSSSEGEADEGLVQPPPPLRTRLRPALAAAADEEPPNALAQPTPIPSSGAQARAAQPAAQPAVAAPGPAPSAAGHPDASKAIAELMLEGWAMLAESCPRCLNPVLRSRDRQRLYCASCQLPVVREGEQQQQQQQQQQPAAAAAALDVPAAEAAPTRDVRGVPASQPSDTQQHLPAVDAAAAAVASRLAGATAALQAAGAGPSEDASAHLAHVRQCAEALQALAECRHSLAGHRH